MKQLLSCILMLLALLFPATATAHEFEVDGIFYNHIFDNEIEVTYQGTEYWNNGDRYTGTVDIPSTVIYNGTTYLPVRGTASLAGMEVTWDGATKSVYLWDDLSPEGTAFLNLPAV